MNYKFNIGDTVKVVKSGQGVAGEHIGKTVTIIEQGTYRKEPGYKVDPPIGNSKTGVYNYMIGESSFEAVYQCLPIPNDLSVIKLRVVKDIPENIFSFRNPSIPKDSITWITSGYMHITTFCIENNRWRTNFPKEYFEEIKEELVPFPPIKKETFEDIFIDDIVVSLEHIDRCRNVGDLFKVLPKSTKDCLYYLPGTNSYYRTEWRKATEEEKWWYENKKIKNISEIYKVGDKVKNINSTWNSNAEESFYNYKEIGIEGTIKSAKFYKNIPCYSVEWVNGKLCGKDATQLEKISEFSKPIQQSKPQPKFKVGDKVQTIPSSSDILGIGWWYDNKGRYEKIDGVENKIGIVESLEYFEEKQMWYYKLDCFSTGKVAEYALFLEEPKPATTKQPLEVFEKILLNLKVPQNLLNDWTRLNNKYDSDYKSYYNTSRFCGDRTIIKVSDSITDDILFQVSDTADSIWLRAEGFKAFYDAEIHKYKKLSNEEILFPTTPEPAQEPEPKLTPAQKLGLVVGEEYRLNDCVLCYAEKEDFIKFYKDDGTDCPLFEKDGKTFYVNLHKIDLLTEKPIEKKANMKIDAILIDVPII